MTGLRDATDTNLDATRVEPTGDVLASVRRNSENAMSGSSLARGALVGRYLVIDELGVGGMGEVFSAYDPELDRRVALKLVKFGASEDVGKARGRLLREAQALAKLSHPNVVAVYDAGTHGDRIFIAMEYVQGRTLRDWLHDEANRDAAETWPRALELMLQAGQGLAAAHAQGLVHRDFKPANVMVSDDGRVHVLDFGLARRYGEGDEDDSGPPRTFELLDSLSGRSSLSEQLTQTGTVMGTPAYMAPEQFFGGTIDARTDQFSFCVVLYRALFGIRPFPGESFRDLGRAVGRGEMREMPKAARVPRAIQTALRRGLSVSRERRYPTMDELLHDLERGVGHNRRRALGLGGGVALLGAVGWLTMVRAAEPERPPPCQGAEDELAGIWDDARRDAMATAFAATELPYAEDARVRIQTALDEHAQTWVGLRTEICEATRVRGDQSEALMDLRIGCLDDKLRNLAALTSLLVEGVDADVVKNASLGVGQLPSLDECKALDRDDSGLWRPDDLALVPQVEQARELVAAATARELAGKYDDGLVKAEQALEIAQRTGYLPVIAEAQLTTGRIQDRRAAPEPTRAHLEEAVYAASASGHARVEAAAMLGLTSVLGLHMLQTDEALRYARHAEAIFQRLDTPPEGRAGVALYRGTTYMAASQLDPALQQFQRCAELSRDNTKVERIHFACLNNMAAVLGQKGQYRRAAEVFEEALRLTEARLGPWHPTMGSTHGNLGVTYTKLEELERSLVHTERALEIYEKVLAPDHPELGRGYHNLGVVQAEMGQLDEALANYRYALELKTRSLGPDHPTVAFSANNVGDALLRLDRPAEALPYFENAMRIWATTGDPNNPNTIYGLISLGQAYLALGKPDEALPPIRKALELGLGGDVDPVEMAKAQFVAARVVLRSGGDREEAIELGRKALAGYQASERPSQAEITEIETWLAHPR